MFKNLIDILLDKAQTQDFWRGLLYIASAAGASISPENAAVIISTTLAISGVVHTLWHKKEDEKK